MRLLICQSALLLVVIGSLNSALAQETDHCRDVLSAALMTVAASGESLSSSDAYTAWQCSFDFKDHNAALKAGLSVGALVYGVPLKVGGTWDANQVDTWKHQNCSNEARQRSFDLATFSYLRQVAPDAIKAWSECMPHTATALSCSASRSPGEVPSWEWWKFRVV